VSRLFHSLFWAGSRDGHIQRLTEHRAKISDRQPEVVKFAKGLKEEGYEKVSLLGYCWGKLPLLGAPSGLS
jgi:hypothetical protein